MAEARDATDNTMNGVVNEIKAWLSAVLSSSTHPEYIWDERPTYISALFYMTRHETHRQCLVSAGVGPLMVTLLRNIRGDHDERRNVIALLAAFGNLLCETSTKLAMREHHIPGLMLAFMQSSTVLIILHATRAIVALSVLPEFQMQIIRLPGMISRLMSILMTDNTELKVQAACVFANCSANQDVCKIIVDTHGAVQTFVGITRDSDENDSVTSTLCTLLFNISCDTRFRTILVKYGVTTVLEKFLQSSRSAILIHVVGCLANLCIGGAVDEWGVYVAAVFPILRASKREHLDRKVYAILSNYVTAPKMQHLFIQYFDTLVSKFMAVTDVASVYNLVRVIYAVVHTSGDVVSDRLPARVGFQRCVEMRERFETTVSNLQYLDALCCIWSESDSVLQWIDTPAVSERVFSGFSRLSLVSYVQEGRYKCVANLMRSPVFSTTVKRNSVFLKHCISELLSNSSKQVRTQAGRILTACTGRQFELIDDIAAFSGVHWHTHDMEKMFRASFTIERTVEPCGFNDRGGGIKSVVVWGAYVDKLRITFFSPFIEVRYPTLFDNHRLFTLELPESVWESFFYNLSVPHATLMTLGNNKGVETVFQTLDLVFDRTPFSQVSFNRCDFSLVVFVAPRTVCDDDDLLREWDAYQDGNDIIVFPVHRRVLSMHSGYFRAMFDLDGDKEETVFDTPIDIVIILLRYMYFGVEVLNIEGIDLLVRVCQEASKYRIQGLQLYCETRLCMCAEYNFECVARHANCIDAPILKLYMVVCASSHECINEELHRQTGMMEIVSSE